MASLELRQHLAAAAGAAISEPILDMIYDRLLHSEAEKTSMPLTLKYDFSIDEIGELECTMTAKCNIGLANKKFKLEADGNQLALFGSSKPDEGSVPAKAEVAIEKVKKPKAKKRVRVASKPPASEVTKRLKAALAAPKKENGAEPLAPSSTASKRMEMIAKENEELFRNGTITRAQAEAAGVPVDLIENGREPSGSVSLSEEEMSAIEDLAS